MLHETSYPFQPIDSPWLSQPDPAELAALEDIRREGWFDSQEPVIASLSEILRAVSSVTDQEAEIVATVAHMVLSGSVALAPDRPTECSR